ncbi:unnamed protein product [Phaeothamnion confervicola]
MILHANYDLIPAAIPAISANEVAGCIPLRLMGRRARVGGAQDSSGTSSSEDGGATGLESDNEIEAGSAGGGNMATQGNGGAPLNGSDKWARQETGAVVIADTAAW